MRGVCDVHRLIKGDKTEREVRYCSACQSNICDECWDKWHWRAIAAMKHVLERK